jgi:uncharacterized lipoprotein YajG
MRKIVLALIVSALAGCSLNTQLMHLAPPASDRVVGALKPVVIESITDDRDFATVPEANGPRLDPSITAELGAERRAKAVSGFPRGGKVILLDDRTVSDAVREVVVASLHSRGYDVVAAADAPADAPRLKIKVTEFWSYLPANFGRALTWTMQLKAWVATDITVKTPTLEREFTVKGYGAHIVQAYKIENVRQAYDLALGDYQQNLDSKIFNAL